MPTPDAKTIPDEVAAAILQAAATMAAEVRGNGSVADIDSAHDDFTQRLIKKYHSLFR